MRWEYKALQYGGICVACGKRIHVDEEAWHCYELHKVRCVDCGEPTRLPSQSEDLKPTLIPSNPVGGSAALREAQLQHDPSWSKGAHGEFQMDRRLHQELKPGAIILTDRQLPNSNANIDHVVIAPSGLWIIDTKKWSGKIEYRGKRFDDPDMRLIVGGQDRTLKVEALYNQVIPVAQLIDDLDPGRSIDIHPAIVFVRGNWSTKLTLLDMISRPVHHDGVLIASPKMLTRKINENGPLQPELIKRLAERLESTLIPR